MPLPERETFFTLENAEQSFILGIDHKNLDEFEFKESYWKELIQWQIDNNGKRELVLIMAPDPRAGLGGLITFTSEALRKKARDLPQTEFSIFLSSIIHNIKHAKQVLLIETNREKYTPINEPYSNTNFRRLTNSKLQKLIGNFLPVNEVLPDITVKNPTYEETKSILLQQSKNGSSVKAEWDDDLDGKPAVTVGINLRIHRTITEIEELSQALTKAHRLSIKKAVV